MAGWRTPGRPLLHGLLLSMILPGCETSELVFRPIDPFAAVDGDQGRVWVLNPKRRVLLLTAEGTGKCRFWLDHGDDRVEVTATPSLSHAGRPRFEIALPPGDGRSRVIATCEHGHARIPVYRPKVGESSSSSDRLTAAWERLTTMSGRAAKHDRVGEYSVSAELRIQEAQVAADLGWRGYDSARLLLSSILSYRAGDLGAAERRLTMAEARIPGWATMQRARLLRFRGYIASERQQHRMALNAFRAAVREVELYGRGGQLGSETVGLATELSHQGRDREALAALELTRAHYRHASRIPSQIFSNAALIEATAFLRNPDLIEATQVRASFEAAWQNYEARSASPPRLAWVSTHAAAFELAVGRIADARAWLDRIPDSAVARLGRKRWLRITVDAAVGAAEGRYTADDVERREQEAVDAVGPSAEARGALAVVAGRLAWQRGQLVRAERALRRGLDVISARAERLETLSMHWDLLLEQQAAVALLADILVRTDRREEAWTVVEQTFANAQRRSRLSAVGTDSEVWRTFTETRAQRRRAERQWCSAHSGADAYACRVRQRDARERFARARDALYRAARAQPPVPVSLDRMRRALKQDAVLYGLRGAHAGDPERYLMVDRSGVVGFWHGWSARTAPGRRLKETRRVYTVGAAAARQLDAATELRVPWSRLSYGGALLGRQSPRTGATVAVLDPDRSLLTLHEAVRLTYARSSVRWLVGAQATASAVRSALASAVRFHFVGHGVVGGSSPMTAFIQLNDGSLTREDVLRLPSVPRVIILEGCETGLIDGMSGLPQAFIARGAWAVLATRRMLRTGEGTAFVRRFIEAGGWDRPGHAFRTAVQASRTHGDDAHSAFVLWGPLSPSTDDTSPRKSTTMSSGGPARPQPVRHPRTRTR